MVDEALRRRGLWRYPAFLTSTNGEVTHACAVNRDLRALFLQADAIHADGMPHVFVSRMKCKVALAGARGDHRSVRCRQRRGAAPRRQRVHAGRDRSSQRGSPRKSCRRAFRT